jgi:hypothetical protein
VSRWLQRLDLSACRIQDRERLQFQHYIAASAGREGPGQNHICRYATSFHRSRYGRAGFGEGSLAVQWRLRFNHDRWQQLHHRMEGRLVSRHEHIVIRSDHSPAELATELRLAAGLNLSADPSGRYAGLLNSDTHAWLTGPELFGDEFDEVAGFNYDLTISSGSVHVQVVEARTLFDAIKLAGFPLPVALALNDYQEDFEIFP